MESHISSHSDRSQFNDLQSLLCGTLQSVLRKVAPEDAPQISDAVSCVTFTFDYFAQFGFVLGDDCFTHNVQF